MVPLATSGSGGLRVGLDGLMNAGSTAPSQPFLKRYLRPKRV